MVTFESLLCCVFPAVALHHGLVSSLSIPTAFILTRDGGTRHSKSMISSMAGTGGGIFYDGPSKFTESDDTTQEARPSAARASSGTNALSSSLSHVTQKDLIIIGGGLAGLSAALYMTQLAPDRRVTIIEKENLDDTKQTTVASMAAAGMLAPQSERLPKGPLLDLCMKSREAYPDFVNLVQQLARQSHVTQHDGAPSAATNEWSVDYVASGGFLAPAFAGDAVATWAPPEQDGAVWLDSTQVREFEPNLHPDVVGGWWFPQDASVDARRLTKNLKEACQVAGVEIETSEVSSLDLRKGKCHGVWCESGQYIKAKSVLVANGAWMRNLLPVPIEPHKGQSLSLRMPSDRPPILKRVLFAQDVYIVPKSDGRIVVGATVEAGSFDGNVTPAGLLHILTHALQLMPGLADLPMEETWVGLRPTTPDKGPILGKTPWSNVFLAGGYWRNGVLLAPKTGQLLASLMAGLPRSPEDDALLDAFAWDRFTSKDGGTRLAANSRYAASMHPIHKRTSGVGVAASVGTELGLYSTARTAREERQADRDAMFNADSEEEAFERAAQMGIQDAAAFTVGDEDDKQQDSSQDAIKSSQLSHSTTRSSSMAPLNPSTTTPFEGSPDAITVPGYAMDGKGARDQPEQQANEPNLEDVYKKIQSNKDAVRQHIEMPEEEQEDKPDPGFRIYFVDPDTRESHEVPPYTTPIDFQEMLAKKKESQDDNSASSLNDAENIVSRESNKASTLEANKGDSAFDGYQAIQNTGQSMEDKQEAFKKARMAARMGFDFELDNPTGFTDSTKDETVQKEDSTQWSELLQDDKRPDLDSVYQRIRSNKEKQTVEMTPEEEEVRQDPGFRIYRVDSETGESHLVPPFTSPQEMDEIITAKKESHQANEVNGSEYNKTSNATEPPTKNGQSEDQKSYDGYAAIQQANSRGTRQEELEAMREARQKNRLGASEIDVESIGAQRPPNDVR